MLHFNLCSNRSVSSKWEVKKTRKTCTLIYCLERQLFRNRYKNLSLTTLRLLGYPLNLRQIPKKYEILTLLSPVGYLLKLDTDIYTCMTPFIDSYDTNASINHMCLLISVNVIRIKDKS